ncbi:hypothetical protein [Klebsiella huaxiensis]|uniref:Uncharacterized protein n=1 Tax=Klebsiella huaxiensis TaxID=2153354 RepID=A0A564HXF0_9ENTR|nr:hypothetical protein [Klebsiella huaxiensis]EMF0787369.1 hypothetical protein [Klebsiella aerogenes]MDG1644852.1 hypothetical protein [Klebsiella huaxiensis]VUS36598.1 hypothetical protein SB6422_04623 [Klebsiella huaxiensis]
MTHNKKWVFSELVKDSNDLSQLIAYAIYKADKDDMANSMRSNAKTEPEIQVKLDDFHDSVATTPRLLQNYQNRAETLMRSVANDIANKAKLQATQQIDAIKAEHIKALKKESTKAVDEYHKKIKQNAVETQTRRGWLWDFTVSGFSGVWATFLLIGGVWLISMATASDDDRNQVTGSFWKRMQNYTSSSPLPDSKNEVAHPTQQNKPNSAP